MFNLRDNYSIAHAKKPGLLLYVMRTMRHAASMTIVIASCG